MRKLGLQVSVLAILAIAALLVFAVSSATAKDDNSRHARARLTGPGEVPFNVSEGTGEFKATIDDQAKTIEYTLTYENLRGAPTTQAHIHIGQRRVIGGVSAFLCGPQANIDNKPCPARSGTVTGTITAADVIGPASQGVAAAPAGFDDLVRAMRAGATYANVHTNPSAGGEIRGQIKVNDGKDDKDDDD